MARRKKGEPRIDGLNPKDLEKIRTSLRLVWSWSEPARIVRKRCLLPTGFSRCENPKCKKICPKVFVDHIKPVGQVLDNRHGGFIVRMWTPSKNLQGLCAKCHRVKTNLERKALQNERAKAEADF